jgi:hypothetical protein
LCNAEGGDAERQPLLLREPHLFPRVCHDSVSDNPSLFRIGPGAAAVVPSVLQPVVNQSK